MKASKPANKRQSQRHPIPIAGAERHGLAEFFRQAPAAIAVVQGPEHTYTLANELYQAVFNRTENQLLGHTIKEVFPEVAGQGIIELFDGVWASGEPFVAHEFPAQFDRAGRIQEGYFNFVAQPIKDAVGTVQSILIHAVEVTDQVLARQKIEESEQHFRALIEHSADAIALLDSSGIVIYASPAVQAILGYKPKELVSKSALKFIHPADLRKVRAHLVDVLARPGKTFTVEQRALHKDGSIKWVESTTTNFLDQPSVRAIVSNFRNITGRKQAEEVLQYHAGLLSSLSDAVISTDMDFKIRSWNKAAEKLYGWKAQEAIGKPATELVPTNYVQARLNFRKEILTKASWRGEVIQKRKNGSSIHVLASVSLVKDASGQPIGAVTVNRDISSRIEQEQRYQRLIESTNVIPWEADAQTGNFTYIGPQAQKLFGYEPRDWYKDGFWPAHIHADDREWAVNFCTEALGTKQEYEFEYRMLTKDGHTVWLRDIVSVVTKDDGGKVLTGYFLDITARREAEEKLKRSEERFALAQKAANIGTFEWSVKTGKMVLTPQLEALYGLPPGGFGGRFENWLNALHPDDRKRAEDELRDAVAGAPLETEVRIIRPDDGSTRWIAIRGRVFYDKRGRPERLLGINRNVSKRKKAEEEANNFFNMPDLLLVIAGADGYFHRLNSAWEQTLGHTIKELKAHPWLHFVHPDDQASTIAEAKKLQKGNATIHFQNRYRCKDGSYKWLLWNVQPVADVLYASARDITPIKQAEEKLNYRTALLEAQNETTPDGILIVDTKNRILSHNRRFVEMWRIPRKIMKAEDDSAALRYAMKQLVSPEDFLERVNYLYEHPDEVSHEKVRFKDGRVFERFGAPVKGADGHRYGWAWHFRDVTEQTKAQKALRESEQHFRATFDQAAVGMAHTALDGRWIRVNQKLCDILGYTKDELLAEKFQNVTHPDDLADSLAAVEAIKSGKVSSQTFQKRYIGKGGRVVWANLTIAPSMDRHGAIEHFITIVEDITERKHSEESLQRHSKVLESMAEGVSVTDSDGYIVFTNPAEDAMFGYKRGELIGQHVTVQNAYAPEENERIVEEVIEQLKKNGSWRGEWENVRKNGEAFQTSARISSIEIDGQQYWICVQEDITDRKKAEGALKESGERFRQLADSMPQIVWTARPDGYLDYYNKQWYEYTGFKESYGNQSWEPLVHPDDVQKCIDSWNHSVRTGEPYQIEYRFKDRSNPGTYRWFLGKALPARDKKGNITKWFGTSTDIDDVRRMLDRKQELEEMTAALTEQSAQLLELNNAKDEFITLASHQLRTPATGVKQFVGMLLEGYEGKMTKGQMSMLQVAYESNERQLKIIDDLLKVAHVDAGRVHLTKSSCDFAELISDVIREQQSTFRNRRQKVDFEKPPRRIKAEVDCRLIRMVLENLIDNASKYSPEGKTVTVQLGRERKQVIITIRDRGVGVAKKDLNLLFQKFSRIDNPLSTTVSGTGLGLYWAKEIIDLHGGTIDVASRLNRGTTFTITLPIAAPASE